MKEVILAYLGRWSAPYSPFNPVSQEDIWQEMDNLTTQLDGTAVDVVLDILKGLPIEDDNNTRVVFWDFLEAFSKAHTEIVSSILLKRLKPDGPREVIEFIGFTKNPALAIPIINTVEYNRLDSNIKIELIDSLIDLGNHTIINWLKKVQIIEKDSRITNEIDIALNHLSIDPEKNRSI